MHELTKARRFTRGMMLFWNVVSFIMLALFTVHGFMTQSALIGSWRGIALGTLVLAYGAWYVLGFRWLMGPSRVWQGKYFGRRALYWVPLLLLPLALVPFDSVFVNLEWIALGSGMGLLLPPWNLVGVAAALGPLVVSWGILPHANTPDAWLQFAMTLLTIAIYCAVIYLPSVLMQQRFKQARLFADLQTAHGELATAHAQLAASAAQERELAVLRERERLARDMHDTLGHALALTTVKIEAIRRLSAIDPDRAARELDATEGIVRGAMGELRATLAALRTPTCLASELARLATEAGARAGMTVTCDDRAGAEWPADVRAALLRIGGEAIANAEQHAHARHLTLTLAQEGAEAVLRVADDGVGLPALPTTAGGDITSPPGHYGLAGMHERVHELGGTLTIVTAPERGTSVEARLPLTPASRPLAANTGELTYAE